MCKYFFCYNFLAIYHKVLILKQQKIYPNFFTLYEKMALYSDLIDVLLKYVFLLHLFLSLKFLKNLFNKFINKI
jgi:hypothetical protein